VGWAGGPDASALAGLPGERILTHAVESLAALLGHPADMLLGQLESWRMVDWQREPYTRGGYGAFPVGSEDVPRALAQPVQGTLFFAGEATDNAWHTGTVHGALATGQRAAKAVLARLRR
jgi:monoamine oxidase